jgi:hypothetical protein
MKFNIFKNSFSVSPKTDYADTFNNKTLNYHIYGFVQEEKTKAAQHNS